jgi:hypothetical protein
LWTAVRYRTQIRFETWVAAITPGRPVAGATTVVGDSTDDTALNDAVQIGWVLARQTAGLPVVVSASGSAPAPPPLSFPTHLSGSSVGLVAALSYLDAVTAGDLTGGARIAVTGTVTVTGDIINVLGVPDKAAAAQHADADILIVPVGNVDDAAGFRGTVVGAGDVPDVLRQLCRLVGGPACDLWRPGLLLRWQSRDWQPWADRPLPSGAGQLVREVV